jgi:cytochrome c
MKGLFLAAAVLAASFAGDAAQGQEVGDAEHGATVFKKCAACHKLGPDARNGVGPVLNGIIGRPAGTYPEYKYTEANKSSGITWEVDTLMEYLRAPRKYIPGTKMPFGGLKNDEDIGDLIAYLGLFDADGQQIE